MPTRGITRTINSRTGAVTNTVDGLISNDRITGVALREYIQSGVGTTDGTPVMVNPTGNSASLTDAPQGPAIGSVTVTDTLGTNYAVTENNTNVVTFTPAVPSGTTATVNYKYHAIGDLINDIKIRPTNVTATITIAQREIILLKNGPKGGFSQQFTPGVGTNPVVGEVNDVVLAILTDNIA